MSLGIFIIIIAIFFKTVFSSMQLKQRYSNSVTLKWSKQF